MLDRTMGRDLGQRMVIGVLACTLIVLLPHQAGHAGSQEPSGRPMKRLIEFGWDEPDTAFELVTSKLKLINIAGWRKMTGGGCKKSNAAKRIPIPKRWPAMECCCAAVLSLLTRCSCALWMGVPSARSLSIS